MSDPNHETTTAHDYTTTTLPSYTQRTNMTREHAPGESATITFTRTIVHHISHTLWVPRITVDPPPATTVWLTIGIAAQRIPLMLRWAAHQFHLVIDESQDLLHRSGLAQQSEDLALLLFHPNLLNNLVAAHAAERLSDTIIYAARIIAWSNTGIPPDDQHVHCARCGDIDFQATTGNTPTLTHYQCPSCHGAEDIERIAAPQIRPKRAPLKTRRASRQPIDQPTLLSTTDLHIHGMPRPYDTWAPQWNVHRILARVSCGGYAISPGKHILTLNEHGTANAPESDTRVITALLQQSIVERGATLQLVGCHGAIHLLRLTRQGQRYLRRWDALHCPRHE